MKHSHFMTDVRCHKTWFQSQSEDAKKAKTILSATGYVRQYMIKIIHPASRNTETNKLQTLSLYCTIVAWMFLTLSNTTKYVAVNLSIVEMFIGVEILWYQNVNVTFPIFFIQDAVGFL